jgi:hypothetical protein
MRSRRHRSDAVLVDIRFYSWSRPPPFQHELAHTAASTSCCIFRDRICMLVTSSMANPAVAFQGIRIVFVFEFETVR